MEISKKGKVKTALIFSGGGSRFGYYMGMYAALCELGKQPDIIIASCGGSHISGLISLCSDPKLAKKMMLSRPFYEMFCRIKPIKPTDNKYLLLTSASKRWLDFQKTKFSLLKFSKPSNTLYQNKIPLPFSLIDSLHNQALYTITDETTENQFWQSEQLLSVINSESHHASNTYKQQKVKTLIVASRSFESSNNKTEGFLWQQILWSDNSQLTKQLQQLQNQGTLTASANNYSQHITSDIHINQDMPLALAIRASINDMFYFKPISYKSHTMLGGVINLLPIEVACQLADTVYAERKSSFDSWLAEPAIHSIFGFFANDRRNYWHNYQPSIGQSKNSQSNNGKIHWIDTTDNADVLPPVLIRKPKPLQGYIDLECPSFKDFIQIMTTQYEYGYDKVMQVEIMQAENGYKK